jgi:choline-glycine betaine transporter
MASIVAKRPVVGVAAGVIFAALGSLLISVEGAQQGIAGVLSGLYTVAGYFMLLVAFLSMVAGAAGIWSRYRSRRCRDEVQETK